MRTYELLIIGAGPAGLAAACFSNFEKHEVAVLEQKSSPGKKLLIAGTGQCNLTNAIPTKDFLDKYGPNKKFVKNCLYKFKNTDLIEFFESNGLKTTTLPNNKVFPESMNSKDVLNTLLRIMDKKGVDLYCESKVTGIQIIDDGYLVTTQKDSFKTEFLCIASGGKSYPSTGSDGSMYSIIESLGHKINPHAPALTPIITNNFNFTSCAGIGLKKTVIYHYRENKKVGTYNGDILFTHIGLSGPGILDNSRYFSENDILCLNLTEFKNAEELENDLIFKLNGPRKKLKNLLSEYNIPERLLLNILSELNIDPSKFSSEVNKKERKSIIRNLIELSFKIDQLGSYKTAMVTKGGVALMKVNPKTMESRMLPSLYFLGEVLDIDGDTGGFNIQFAFSSAASAIDAINLKKI